MHYQAHRRWKEGFRHRVSAQDRAARYAGRSSASVVSCGAAAFAERAVPGDWLCLDRIGLGGCGADPVKPVRL